MFDEKAPSKRGFLLLAILPFAPEYAQKVSPLGGGSHLHAQEDRHGNGDVPLPAGKPAGYVMLAIARSGDAV